MSIDASRWARLADVQKSSNKAVLLELAHLVRYGATAWTAFASIEYLARITHLNRKTVIDSLARLRELGVIQDTGRKAGANRSCPVYSLCPSAVPLVCEPDAAGAGTLDIPTDEDGNGDDQHQPPVPPGEGAGQAQDPHAPAAPPKTTSADASASGSATAAPGRRQKAPTTNPPVVAGAGGSCLAPGWTLPETWRAWTAQVRPRWTAQQTDALAATFGAYWRSKGDAGLSADWFETWRGWVFRQRDKQTSMSGRAWDSSWSGIVAKGEELRLFQGPSESCPAFRQRVHDAVHRAASSPALAHNLAQFRA
ncbi:helix-turn-helix domain-containing protein [Verticiella alkaliphila]|uniref:helix-turn-helix domain-containing protein n=1 Tax=Verticiella alkaliphila TaxID=2779529 RepID=UPI00353008D9